MGTCLSVYDIAALDHAETVAALERHGMTALGERADITLSDVQEILAACN